MYCMMFGINCHVRMLSVIGAHLHSCPMGPICFFFRASFTYEQSSFVKVLPSQRSSFCSLLFLGPSSAHARKAIKFCALQDIISFVLSLRYFRSTVAVTQHMRLIPPCRQACLTAFEMRACVCVQGPWHELRIAMQGRLTHLAA